MSSEVELPKAQPEQQPNDKAIVQTMEDLNDTIAGLTIFIITKVNNFDDNALDINDVNRELRKVKRLTKSISILTDRVSERRAQLVQSLRIKTRKELNETE